MAHGSDGGGSIRTPSHCCGVFGFVPTQGRAPIAANGYGFPVEFVRQHVITRSVRDSAVMLDVIARRDFSPTTSCAADSFYNRIDNSPKILKIAFTINNPSGLPVSNDCVEAVLSVARCLEGFGHNLIDASPMYNWAPFVQSFVSNWHLFIAHAIDILETRTGLQATEEFIEAAQLEASERVRQTGPLDIASHLHTIYSAAEDFSAFFTDIDILLTPTSVKLASELGARRAGSFNENPEKWVFENIGTSTPHLMIVNASGQPAMSVPTHFSSEGLPVGVQLIARHNDEVTLLQIATILETAFPWRKRLLDLSKAKPSNPDIVPKSASSSFTSLSGPTPTIC